MSDSQDYLLDYEYDVPGEGLLTRSAVLEELDPTYQGPIFPDFSLEEPGLESIMGDLVP